MATNYYFLSHKQGRLSQAGIAGDDVCSSRIPKPTYNIQVNLIKLNLMEK